MRKPLIALTCALMLTACGTDSGESTTTTSAQPTSLDFATESSLGVDMTDQQPGTYAKSCDERPVLTTDGYVSLKNVEIKDGEIHYFFAPHGSSYNSYVYHVEFDHGEIIVRDISSDSFETTYRVKPGADWKPLNVGLGSNFYGASFEIPEDVHNELGKITYSSASVNGEHAGTCKF